VVDYRPEKGEGKADLVICQGVLQYLDAREARRAVGNLARLTGGALYLEVLTRNDWEENCNQSITDGDVYLRDAAWYRRELSRSFIGCGGGVFVHRKADVVLYDMERA
jgi:hypothetical protein